MDKYGLVGILGRAFQRRRLVCEEGRWRVTGALFHGYFHLCEIRSMFRVDSSRSDVGRVQNLEADYTTKEHTSVKPYSPWKTQAMEVPPEQISHLKVDLSHTFGLYLRVGFLALVKSFGGHTIRWDCQMIDFAKHLQHDSFWVDCPHSQMKKMLQGPLGSPEDFQTELRKIHNALKQAEKRRRPSKEKTAPPKKGIAEKDLLSALQASDRLAMSKQVVKIPPALKQKVFELPYEIAFSTWGLQVDGCQKYMGSGVLKNTCNTDRSIPGLDFESENTDRSVPLVQFSTFFTKDHSASNHTKMPSAFGRKTALSENQFSEFVSSINVLSGCFTIERALLDAGSSVHHNIDAVAISEQLFAPVWEPSGFAIFAQTSLLPVERVKEIKLSKVLDWNTYVVMCLALIRRGALEDVFRDSFGDGEVLQEEMTASKVSDDEAEVMPLVDIFMRTGLGKLVKNVLELWQKRTSVLLECTDAKVVLQESQEYVQGELHRAMEITCKVEVVSRKHVDSSQHPSLPNPKVMEEWAALIREVAPDQMEYGFQLGQQGIHEHVRAVPVLRAVSRALHNLQRERGWSSLAIADSAGTMIEQLQQQRSATDACFMDALALTTSTTVRMVTTNLLLVRAQVDADLGKGKLQGKEAYERFCTAPGTFNSLIGTLLEWLVRATFANPEIQELESQKVRLFCYFKEILGRERAFILCCRGSSQPTEALERQAALMAKARKVMSGWSEAEFRFLFKQLDEAHVVFMENQHDPLAWFDVMSSCIDVCQRLVEELLGDLGAGEVSSPSLSQLGKAGKVSSSVIEISL
eukprot:TRINITY_DN27036_c0_g2_i1.p1 TRINITY_DN27036_c0_g2~~TRINITY_DN27036_c0_g2_i1.p1  ORF type:complete len:874 (+),score=153.14 TRINITY_DN27036_c0_g2_i1:210-2624(+)